ncbi:MAG: hypothetical protein AB1758_34345, partial [Candidatus Eremiobacterota bacterium]
MQRGDRELRVGFAMGGGVALGTFNGAALSEALKLLIRHAFYDDDGVRKRYQRVVVDVFSGASAGSMSLFLMLRSLAHPERLDQAAGKLGELGSDDLPEGERLDLLAAQAMQNDQYEAWVEEVHIDGLLGRDPKRELAGEPGILGRGLVDAIAARRLRFSDGGLDGTFPNRRILGKRVLYCSTLANLTATLVDARGEQGAPGDPGLADPFTSRVHRDVRVFDLNFVDLGGRREAAGD